ncbi:hypothetical protein ABZS93_05325 [Streptomyces sp900116325]|uniref:hypothetical protein n=1 Tax=Streptomyces sp. 900116325 TaxID=3154295 RepID=UPI0033AEB40E
MFKRFRMCRAGAGLLVTAALSVSVAGCSSGGQGDGPATTSASGDPATWVLPIQAYLPTDEEQQQLSQAKKLLVGDCMKGFGFNWVPAPDLPKVGPKTLTDWRYGIHDMNLSRERGYKPAATEMAAYDAALKEGAQDRSSSDKAEIGVLNGTSKDVHGRKVPKGGCIGAANRKINTVAVEARTAIDLGNGAFIKAKQDPAVVKAFAAWSGCMKKSGYDYKEPLDASDNPKFGSEDVTAEEISTATTDITCRDRTDVARIWFTAEAALQKQAIEQHAEQLQTDRRALGTAVKKASKLVSAAK